MAFQKEVGLKQAIGNAGQISNATHSFLNVVDYVAGENISVGEFAQSSTNENEALSTSGKALTGSILGIVVNDSLKNKKNVNASLAIQAGEPCQIIDAGNVFIETKKDAGKGDFVLISESDGSLEFRNSKTLTGYAYTGWRVCAGNETNAGLIEITTAKTETSENITAKKDIRDFGVKVLENGENALLTANSIEFNNVNQGFVFDKEITKLRFTLPSNGEQSVYFGIRASKNITGTECFFHAITLNSRSSSGFDDGWNDWMISNIFLRDANKGVFNEGGTRDVQQRAGQPGVMGSGGWYKDDGKDFSSVTGLGTGERIEISYENSTLKVENLKTGAVMSYTFAGYKDFRGNFLDFRFGFFTRSYKNAEDFTQAEGEYYASLEPLDSNDYVNINVPNLKPLEYTRGGNTYKITGIEIID